MTVGRIVRYKLSEQNVAEIGRRRTNSNSIAERIVDGKWPQGAQAHFGNPHLVGQELPMLAVNVFPDEFGKGVPGVNGQVFLDGNDVLWITSAKEGLEPGQWHWPARE